MFSSNIEQYLIEEKVDLIAHKLKLHTEFADKEADDVRIANQDTFFEMRRYSGLDHMIFKVYPPRLSDYNNYDKFSIYPSFGINNKKYYWGMGEGLPSNLISFNNEKFQKQFINRNDNTPFFGISRQNTYNDLSLTDLENLYIGTNTKYSNLNTIHHKFHFKYKTLEKKHKLNYKQDIVFDLIAGMNYHFSNETSSKVFSILKKYSHDFVDTQYLSFINNKDNLDYFRIKFILKPITLERHKHNKELYKVFVELENKYSNSDVLNSLQHYWQPSKGKLNFYNLKLNLDIKFNSLSKPKPIKEGNKILFEIGSLVFDNATYYNYHEQKTLINDMHPNSKKGFFIPYKDGKLDFVMNMEFNKLLNKDHTFYVSGEHLENYLDLIGGKIKMLFSTNKDKLSSEYKKINLDKLELMKKYLKENKTYLTYKRIEEFLKHENH